MPGDPGAPPNGLGAPPAEPGLRPAAPDGQPTGPVSGAEPTEGQLDADTVAPPADVAASEPAGPMDAPSGAPRTGRRPLVLAGYLAAALAGALLLAGSLVAFGGLGRATPSPSPTPTPAPNEANGRSLGSAAAPVTVEIWADYQCPYCQAETLVFGGSLERAFVLPGSVRVVFRDFAFLGQESTDAAVAARCAGRQDPGAYWRYHDLLFAAQKGENQGAFSRANLVTFAGIAALDATPFTACLDDPSVAKAVAAETAAGRALGVESTPTLRVTGPGGTRTLPGFSSSWSTIRDAISAVAVPAPSAGGSPGGSASPTAPGTPTPSPTR